MAKILIAYFSRNGNNYFNGGIKNLEVGNTEVVANIIHNLIGGDMFHIETLEKYPEDYDETTEVAKKELHSNARPKLKAKVNDFDSYDTIILGYPNWWNTMPMAVWTFLESYDFSNKTIIPFCTNEGSGMGASENDIKKLAPNVNLLKGLSIIGSRCAQSKEIVSKWLKNLNLL